MNVFTFGYSRNAITQIPVLSAVSRAGLSIPEVFPGNFYDSIPNVTLTGYGNIGVGGLTNNVNNVYEWRDDLNHIRGNHSLKFVGIGVEAAFARLGHVTGLGFVLGFVLVGGLFVLFRGRGWRPPFGRLGAPLHSVG